MILKMEKMNQIRSNKPFKITSEWCMALNNIYYLKRSIKSFFNGFDEIVLQELEKKSLHSIDQLVEISTKHTERRTLTKILVKNMNYTVYELLTKKGSKTIDHLMAYLDDSLKILFENLDITIYDSIVNEIWKELCSTILSIIEISIKVCI